MNISSLEIGEDLAVLGAAGTTVSFAGLLIAKNIKHRFSLFGFVSFWGMSALKLPPSSVSHSFPVPSGCKGQAGWWERIS